MEGIAMRKVFITSLVVVFFVGCGTENKSLELEQQRLLLELTKTNNERLAELTQKEQELKSLEKKNQDVAEQLKQREALLGLQERKSKQLEKVFVEKVAAADARIKDAQMLLEKRMEEVRAEEVRNQETQRAIQAKEDELNRRFVAIRQRQEEKRQAQEAARREQEERQRPEIVERLRRRKPDLDQLIDLTTDLAIKYGHSGFVRSTIRKELSDIFHDTRWGKIAEEDAFAHKAASNAYHNYLKRKINEHVFAAYSGNMTRSIHKWRDDYIKRHQKVNN